MSTKKRAGTAVRSGKDGVAPSGKGASMAATNGAGSSGNGGNLKDPDLNQILKVEAVIQSKQSPNPLHNISGEALTKYNSVLSRRPEEGVAMADLDHLQLELEYLLTRCALKLRTYYTELEDITCGKLPFNAADSSKSKQVSLNTSSSSKRGTSRSTRDERESKRFKDASPSDVKQEPDGSPGDDIMDSEENMVVASPEISDDRIKLDDPTKIVNPIPGKFWNSVLPYCADIQDDDVQFLEDMIGKHEDIGELMKIPPLGKHYTLKWAAEDGHSDPSLEQNENHNGFGNSASTKEALSLSERLIGALIEENIITGPIDQSTVTGGAPLFDHRQTKTENKSLEMKIKDQLKQLGLLDFDTTSDAASSMDDEILLELKRCQAELKSLSEHNAGELNRLLQLAKKQKQKQSLVEQLNAIDQQVSETYKRIAVYRQKKKSPSKKEKEDGWKLLKQRQALIKAIDAM